MTKPSFRLQFVIFALVSASFTNIYITQPILPVLQKEFGVDAAVVSFSVSAVILGIVLSNLPVGFVSDRLPVQPIILTGGVCTALGGLACAATENFWLLIGARFFQGLFIPAMTTCVAAYLAKTLPKENLNVVMGAYVSATVLGGLGGRMLGGFVHSCLHWRYAFATASVFILAASLAAWKILPDGEISKEASAGKSFGYFELLNRRELLPIYFCAAGGLAIFSTVFNFLPFRLSGPPFNFSTEKTTLFYLVYIVGIFIGPTAGRIGDRFGAGAALLGGAFVLGLSLVMILVPSKLAIVSGLLFLCAGYFTVHATAVGSLNRKLAEGQGRANALYVLFYYTGGWIGITVGGFAYEYGGWNAVVSLCSLFLIFPFCAGYGERKNDKRSLR